MLQSEPNNRLTLQQIRYHPYVNLINTCNNILKYFFCRWFNTAPEKIGEAIPVPPLKGDPFRCSTVLPYLEAYHYQSDRDVEDVYFTEHDLNR